MGNRLLVPPALTALPGLNQPPTVTNSVVTAAVWDNAPELRGIVNMTVIANWFLWALLSAVFAALTAIFAKLGLVGVDPDLATFVRAGIILVVLGAFLYASDNWSNPFALPVRTWCFLLLSGLATGASWICYFRALHVGDASKVAPVDKLSLVLVAIFAVVFLNERPSPREWLGICLVAFGVLVFAIKR